MKIKKTITVFVLSGFLATGLWFGANAGNAKEEKSVSDKVTETLSKIAEGLKAEGEEKRKQFREESEGHFSKEKDGKFQSSQPSPKENQPSKAKESKHQ